MNTMHVIMPVKDSMHTARQAIAAVMQCQGVDFTVYNDFSTVETTAELQRLSQQHGFALVNWCEHTHTPSPNYRLTLQHAQRRALEQGADLVIVESDVSIGADTLGRLQKAVAPGVGLVAAVTVDEAGGVNFPYRYARHYKRGTVETRKRLSFCCTLLSNALLQAIDFNQLDPTKQWFDVYISHRSVELGMRNLLLTDAPVLHRPHSSRPWKQLKYKRPLLYYWQKITRKRDRI